MKLLEMPLQVKISFTFPPAQATGVRLLRFQDPNALKVIELPPFLSLFADPKRDMDESMAIGIGDDINNGAELGSGEAKEKGRMVRGGDGRFIVEVPEDRDGRFR